jgi:hypothetical protein
VNILGEKVTKSAEINLKGKEFKHNWVCLYQYLLISSLAKHRLISAIVYSSLEISPRREMKASSTLRCGLK